MGCSKVQRWWYVSGSLHLAQTPAKATVKDLARFHTDDYLHALEAIETNFATHGEAYHKYNLGIENPILPYSLEFASKICGGSLEAARRLNTGECKTAIHWAGGMHHARPAQAKGFCYANDAVLAVLELLKQHKRVLYVSLDPSHCTGIEEAFYTTDRVCTLSFHQYGEFVFPGTGSIKDIGKGKGKYYAVNVPIKGDIAEDDYVELFSTVFTSVSCQFRPDVVVLLCSPLALPTFSLSSRAIVKCVETVLAYHAKVLFLGGVSMSIEIAAKLWTDVTSIVLQRPCGTVVPEEMLNSEYGKYFKNSTNLVVDAEFNVSDIISTQQEQRMLKSLKAIILDNVKMMEPLPPQEKP